MQKILIDDISPGSVIAKDILNHEGVMLIPKGTILRDKFISQLHEIGVEEILVEENEQESAQRIKEIQKSMNIDEIIFEKTRIQAQMQIKKLMVKFSTMNHMNLDKIKYLVEDIIEQLLLKKDIVLTLSRLRSIDNYTYEHSVNVCVLSLIVGIDLNLDRDSLKNLGIGAILHDIGKVGVSEGILKKPSRLTEKEFEEVRRHTQYGYDILTNTNISEEAAQIALCHHEKYDGTGYNRRLKGESIPLYSRIVAVTDVYDAMSNDRVYKKKMSPDKVFKEIARMGNKHFDREIMEKFVRHLSLYPTGTGVILNTNHRGIVIEQNRLLPESPIIRLFKKDKSSNRSSFVDVDLSTTRYLFIKDTF